MFPEALSNNSTSLSEEEDISGGGSSATKFQNLTCFNNPTTIFSSPTTTTTISPPLPPPEYHHHHQQEQQKIKRKRNLPGNPDPDAEVIALSPKSLLATNRFVCEICNKGFQRDQNLQLHRRGHNLPWKLKQKSTTDKKRVYVCPEVSCVHHDPSRALGDLTGIKKHFGRKHGEKKWKCEKCARKYAVQSDWKAHLKTCGTKEYRCDCGSLFSRKDSFITHRAFCDALAEESARLSSNPNLNLTPTNPTPTSTDHHHLHHPLSLPLHSFNRQHLQNPPPSSSSLFFSFTTTSTIHQHQENIFPLLNPTPLPPPISLLSSWKPPSHENPPHHQNPPHHHNPNTPTTPISSYFHESPPPNFLIDQTNHSVLPNPNASPHMSATALLQKAASVGSASISTTRPSQTQSVGHMTTAPQSLNELTGPLSQMGGPDQYLGFTTSSSAGNNNQSTWQKDDHLTRDFLGLAEGDHQHHHGGAGDDGGGRNGGDGGGNGGGGNVSQRGWSTGGVDFRTYDHDHSLLKQPQPSAFGFASTWGDC